jgi:hypothetical protein
VKEPSPIYRFIWIILIAVAASFSAGMYLAGLDALNAVIDKPGKLAITAIAATYAAFLVLILFNRNLRLKFLESFSRSNRILGNIIQSLIGVGPTSYRSDGPLTRSDLLEYLHKVEISEASGAPSALSVGAQQEIANIVREELSKSSDKTTKADEIDHRQTGPEGILENSYIQIRSASSTVAIRGFANLVIGIVFALGALYFLRESVALIDPERIKQMTTPEVSYFVAVRVSLSLIITLISYFFLSLYRKSLDDVKYYQNELTYISGRLAALALTVGKGADRHVSSIIPFLMNSDRNRSSRDLKNDGDSVNIEKLIQTLMERLPTAR